MPDIPPTLVPFVSLATVLAILAVGAWQDGERRAGAVAAPPRARVRELRVRPAGDTGAMPGERGGSR